MSHFTKVLVANRGEIAVRVFRTARTLGYATVAVFSDADAGAPHVRAADEAVRIGPAAVTASYLNVEAILDAAARTGADAIHPGYGFLSENAGFAEACLHAGLVWIGPPPEAIRAMGDKARAKAHMEEAGVPTVPGFHGADADDATLLREAQAVGFPLLVKAVGGGGGRGMRLVREPQELADAVASARREAEHAFGDRGVMLEAFVENARHIEIQVFADAQGHVIHLGERDCTTQRRRQKVIEEAPSPALDESLRAQMGADAVRAAAAIGYVGAGTVEMILGQDGRHFFLEMNTRLQVEHPVTEMVTGQDLVAWQLRVAAGEPLPMSQDDVVLHGHAIEARLYAEDPSTGFSPQTGTLAWFRPHALSDWPGIRVDAGVEEGSVVTPHYDPMIAKVLAHGATRHEAARKLARALEALPLVGLRTNRRFLIQLLRDPAFGQATLTTHTLDRWVDEGHALLATASPSPRAWAVAAALFASAGRRWFRSTGAATVELELMAGATSETRTFDPYAPEVTVLAHDHGALRYLYDGVQRTAFAHFEGSTWYLDDGDGVMSFTEASPYPSTDHADDPRRLVSPVAGTVLRLEVIASGAVAEGDTVAIIEAMKMETRLIASRAGTVRAIHASVGDQVEANALIVELDLED